jgi:hypothetical protein
MITSWMRSQPLTSIARRSTPSPHPAHGISPYSSAYTNYNYPGVFASWIRGSFS